MGFENPEIGGDWRRKSTVCKYKFVDDQFDIQAKASTSRQVSLGLDFNLIASKYRETCFRKLSTMFMFYLNGYLAASLHSHKTTAVTMFYLNGYLAASLHSHKTTAVTNQILLAENL